MAKIMFVFGTRPEIIKLSPVIISLKRNKNIKYKICVTAQHRTMLDEAMKIFSLKSNYDLNIMVENQTMEHISIETMKKLKKVYEIERPDLVIVQGDTTSAMIASLEAYYLKIPVAHIEAGLRTHDIFNPYPEELNRVFIDKISKICFAPTKTSYKNLISEKVDKEKILITGNTVIDALKIVSRIRCKLNKKLKEIIKEKFILLTSHRRENFGEPHRRIFKAINHIANYIPVVYPVHPNPNVHKLAYEMLSNNKNIILTRPLSYSNLIQLMKYCFFIITDSGGIQEEAPFFKKPVLVIREKTERPEGIKLGIAKLVGTDTEKIIDEAIKLIENNFEYKKMQRNLNPYGDGKASNRIIAFLEYYFGYRTEKPSQWEF